MDAIDSLLLKFVCEPRDSFNSTLHCIWYVVSRLCVQRAFDLDILSNSTMPSLINGNGASCEESSSVVCFIEADRAPLPDPPKPDSFDEPGYLR